MCLSCGLIQQETPYILQILPIPTDFSKTFSFFLKCCFTLKTQKIPNQTSTWDVQAAVEKIWKASGCKNRHSQSCNIRQFQLQRVLRATTFRTTCKRIVYIKFHVYMYHCQVFSPIACVITLTLTKVALAVSDSSVVNFWLTESGSALIPKAWTVQKSMPRKLRGLKTQQLVGHKIGFWRCWLQLKCCNAILYIC